MDTVALSAVWSLCHKGHEELGSSFVDDELLLFRGVIGAMMIRRSVVFDGLPLGAIFDGFLFVRSIGAEMRALLLARSRFVRGTTLADFDEGSVSGSG